MRIAGIICEYNPFHNGHAHQLAVLREAGYAPVCVMSGDYVQRGEPAVIPAAARAEAAVRCGAALVLELPPSYALRSAEGFADGGVELLDRLGCAEALCFGSESGDAEALLATARTLLSPELVPLLKHALREFCKLRRKKCCCGRNLSQQRLRSLIQFLVTGPAIIFVFFHLRIHIDFFRLHPQLVPVSESRKKNFRAPGKTS